MALALALALLLGASAPASGRAFPGPSEQSGSSPAPTLLRGSLPDAPSRAVADQAADLPADSLQQIDADREALLDWLDRMQGLMPPLERYAQPGVGPGIGLTRERVLALSDAEMAQLSAAIGAHEGFWEIPDLIGAILDPGQPMPPFYAAQAQNWASMRGLESVYGLKLPAAPPGLRAPSGPLAVNTPAPTAAPYPTMDPFPPRGDAPERPESRPGCPGIFDEGTCDECGPSIPLEAVFAVKVAHIIANGLNDTFSDGKLDFCLPPGIGFTVPDPVKAVTVGIAAALEGIVATLEFINDLNEECEGGYEAALVDLYLDETISSRVTQASYDAHAMLEMRVEIEAVLLNQADNRVSLFQMPQARCGDIQFDGYRFCGKLELAREIVADSIQNNQDALSVTDLNNARAELNAGDMHYMSSQWKAAFERYSKAYRFAVKQRSER